ncbi:MAG: hypothetical protein ACRYGK_06750 [Janthinobacterium lividum]
MPRHTDSIEDAQHEWERDQRLKALETRMAALEIERAKAVKWGIGVVGSLFAGMATLIFNYVKDHLK